MPTRGVQWPVDGKSIAIYTRNRRRETNASVVSVLKFDGGWGVMMMGFGLNWHRYLKCHLLFVILKVEIELS